MISHEEIKRANPVFNVFSCQILAAEKVSVVSQKNSSESERILVVGTPGVGVFRDRIFPRGLFQRSFISYADINKLIVSARDVRIISASETIVFRHANQLRIASRIHATRCALFDQVDLPYVLEVAADAENLFSSHVFVYHASSLLADRFLASVVRTKQTLESGSMEKVCHYLMELKNSIEVNKRLLGMNYINAIAMAVAYDRGITEMRIKGIAFGVAGPFVTSVLAKTVSIRRVMFVKMYFDQVCQEYLDMMKSSETLRADEWIFEECNLDVGYFMRFFNAFIKYKASVKMLTFNKCSFAQDMFEEFSQTLLFSKCFHKIEVLWLADIQFPDDVLAFLMQLCGSDWLIKNQTLHTLAIVNCFVNLDKVFQQLMRFHTGIVTANFSGNPFVNPPSPEFVKTLSPQMTLVFANCGYAEGSMAGLFESLASHKGVSLSLDCSGAVIRKEEWRNFERVLSHTVMPTLTELVWDKNPITPENVHSFIEFFKNQPKLTSLSISDCIAAAHGQEVLGPLCEYFRVCTLTSLTIASTSQATSLGAILTPALEHVLKHYTLKFLDISGQNIGDEGLIKVTELMPLAMEEFRFEGNSISNASAFIQIMHSLLDKRLKGLTWPEKDIKPSLVKVPVAQRGEIIMQIELIRKQYYQQYGKAGADESADVALATIMKYTTVANPAANNQGSSETVAKISAFESEETTQDDQMDVFRIQNDQTRKFLAECACSDKNDPMKAMYERMCHEFSLETLKAALK